MSKTIFCKRCLYNSKHPLGLIIDGEGICSGVGYMRKKIF